MLINFVLSLFGVSTGLRENGAVGIIFGLYPAKAAAQLGCKVGLYNHGGWFGDPDNELAVLDIEALRPHGKISFIL